MILRNLNMFGVLILLAVLPARADAAPHSATIPLKNGWLSTSVLRDAMVNDLGIPQAVLDCFSSLDVGVDLRAINRSTFVQSTNEALGLGFHVDVTDNAFTIRFDPDLLPTDWNATCDTLRRFTQTLAPLATARQQQRFGLHLPQAVDPDRPLVILIHGLDGDIGCCADLAGLMTADGYQIATFAYPSEEPLDQSARLLTNHMKALHDLYPNLRIELVTESMGGLVARRYVEGPQYAGGVDRLILIAPPNDGSTWTRGAFVLKAAVNFFKWRSDSDWSPAWMITEGLCQAASDLRPRSDFLRELNSQPRRLGVRYTIIAGDRPIYRRYEANILAVADSAIGSSVSDLWGFRQLKHTIESHAHALLESQGDSDGPVTLASARLEGVDDFVIVHSDHIALYETVAGQPPAAYPIIRQRLKN